MLNWLICVFWKGHSWEEMNSNFAFMEWRITHKCTRCHKMI